MADDGIKLTADEREQLLCDVGCTEGHSRYCAAAMPDIYRVQMDAGDLVERVESIVAARVQAAVAAYMDLTDKLAESDAAARAELAAANTRIAELEAEVQRWSDRMWASVQERMTWQHVVGEHAGDVPFQHCPVCEATHHRAENAALSARLERVRALADEWEAMTDPVFTPKYRANELRIALGEDA